MGYRDKETLERMYWEEEMSMREMSEVFDCAISSVHRWMDKYSVKTRKANHQKPPKLTTDRNGYQYWCHNDVWVPVHRLIAVAEFGFDGLENMEVHHINDIPWDNRPGNLGLMTEKEHGKHSAEKRWG